MKLISFLLIIFLPFCFKNAYAQNEYQVKDSVAKYYFCRNKAELAIVDSNYFESLNFYKKAFLFKSANARDLANGLRLAIILNDTLFARTCMGTLAANGLPQRVTLNFMGEEWTQAGGLYSYLAGNYDSLVSVYENSKKAKLSEMLERIYERDQLARRGGYTEAEAAVIDKKNIDSLIWFSGKYGFPCFQLLGFAEPSSGIGRAGIYGFILWHSREQEIGALDSLGLRAVMAGLYPPEEFAQSFDFKSPISKYHMLVPGISSNLDPTKTALTDEVVNLNRAAIYLESIEDYKRKLLYMERRGKNWYRFLLAPQLIYGMNFAK